MATSDAWLVGPNLVWHSATGGHCVESHAWLKVQGNEARGISRAQRQILQIWPKKHLEQFSLVRFVLCDVSKFKGPSLACKRDHTVSASEHSSDSRVLSGRRWRSLSSASVCSSHWFAKKNKKERRNQHFVMSLRGQNLTTQHTLNSQLQVLFWCLSKWVRGPTMTSVLAGSCKQGAKHAVP